MRRDLKLVSTALCCLLALLLAVPAAASAEEDVERARQATKAGDYETALARFEAALTAGPNELMYGAEYRQTAIAAKAYDRAIDFFAGLVEDHPDAPNAWLNYGYAYVDKIPDTGAVTQVLLANQALGRFSKALELEDTWLGRFTRGNSYLYWPAIFGRTDNAIADLERAIELGNGERAIHARAWVGLGDAYWRLDDLAKSREIWRQGLEHFPDDTDLKTRLARDDEALDEYLGEQYDPGRRVATDLRALKEETP